MMHLTASTSVSPIPRLVLPLRRVACSGHLGSVAEPLADSPLAAADLVFFRHMPNSLEKPPAEFHYSVIGRFTTDLLASGFIGGHLSNDDDAASGLEVDAFAGCVELAPSRVHKIVMKGVSDQSGRLRFRTGGRKVNPNDCDPVEDKQVDLVFAYIRLMRIDENIHATSPTYATVAPILYSPMHKTPIDRSTTPSNGAADAAGR